MSSEQAQALTWPAAPTCHARAWPSPSSPLAWRPPRPADGGPYAATFRTCSYCGSIHPEDLLVALRAGARLVEADWKYGWPHKFYVEGIANPIAGQPCVSGSESWTDPDGTRRTKPIPGTAPEHLHAKWYNDHLADLDDAAFAVLAREIETRTRIRFARTPKGLHYCTCGRPDCTPDA